MCQLQPLTTPQQQEPKTFGKRQKILRGLQNLFRCFEVPKVVCVMVKLHVEIGDLVRVIVHFNFR